MAYWSEEALGGQAVDDAERARRSGEKRRHKSDPVEAYEPPERRKPESPAPTESDVEDGDASNTDQPDGEDGESEVAEPASASEGEEDTTQTPRRGMVDDELAAPPSGRESGYVMALASRARSALGTVLDSSQRALRYGLAFAWRATKVLTVAALIAGVVLLAIGATVGTGIGPIDQAGEATESVLSAGGEAAVGSVADITAPIDDERIETELRQAVNDARAANGVEPLGNDTDLNAIADWYAGMLAERDVLAHSEPDGDTFSSTSKFDCLPNEHC